MTTPRVCVLRAPGTNCDVETAYAFDLCGADSERMHLNRLLEKPDRLNDFQILCIPGGFSFGDDIAAGVIFSQQLASKLVDTLGRFLQKDTLILGICNGFQVLLKAGILPEGPEKWPRENNGPRNATLTWNDNGKYTAVWVRLNIEATHNVFLKDITEIEMPVAHAEGRIAVTDSAILNDWKRDGQIAMRYIPVRPSETNGSHVSDSSDADTILPYPDNPNGSLANIAGLSDPTGRVLGLMPHPERFIHATQHPQWTRLNLKGNGEGLKLFQNAVNYYA